MAKNNQLAPTVHCIQVQKPPNCNETVFPTYLSTTAVKQAIGPAETHQTTCARETLSARSCARKARYVSDNWNFVAAANYLFLVL